MLKRLLTFQDRANDLDVLARARKKLAVYDPVPAFDDLRA
jgi:hypothetical protein